MKKFVLFALNMKDLNKEEQLVQTLFDNNYFGDKVNICNGVYKGVAERSYMVPFETRDDIKFIELLAQKFNQESVLVCAHGSCYLSYLSNGHKLPIGKWTEVTQDEAFSHNAYTEMNGLYYICKGE